MKYIYLRDFSLCLKAFYLFLKEIEDQFGHSDYLHAVLNYALSQTEATPAQFKEAAHRYLPAWEEKIMNIIDKKAYNKVNIKVLKKL